jgi:hypothetical protein
MVESLQNSKLFIFHHNQLYASRGVWLWLLKSKTCWRGAAGHTSSLHQQKTHPPLHEPGDRGVETLRLATGWENQREDWRCCFTSKASAVTRPCI